jgi:pilus assembly protein Flp/PilA
MNTNEWRNTMKKLMSFFKDEEGATAVEYGIMVALIAIVIIAAVTLVGQGLSTTFQSVADTIPS